MQIYLAGKYHDSSLSLVSACSKAKELALDRRQDTKVINNHNATVASYTWKDGKLVPWVK